MKQAFLHYRKKCRDAGQKKISLRRKTDFHPDIIFSLHDSFSVKKVIFAKQT